MSYPKPDNEAKRLEALRHYHILDSAPEQGFDDFVQIASFVCETPIALITLVDSTRQWFKARVGVSITETPREHAFCSYTILGEETMIVTDATKDERFSSNPLVTGNPNIRFYAGVPLIDHEGFALGSLCVIDRQPRHLTPGHYKTLEALSRKITLQLEMRRTADELVTALADIKTLHGLLPICPHCKGIRNDAGYWQSVESYLESHTEAHLNQSVCPKCFHSHSLDLAPGD
ncbi:hypothetical protein BH11VER1_BH11VER1_40150 [soil metagenome]